MAFHPGFQGLDTDPRLEERGEQQGRPWIVCWEHACKATSTPQVREKASKGFLFVVRKQASEGLQRRQFFVHPCSPRWHAATHAPDASSRSPTFTEGGVVEGEVVRGRPG